MAGAARESEALRAVRPRAALLYERRLLSTEDLLILRLRSNPDPIVIVTLHDGQSAVILSDSHGPELAARLELKRGMLRVVLPNEILLPGRFSPATMPKLEINQAPIKGLPTAGMECSFESA